jgi:hypothetical protein
MCGEAVRDDGSSALEGGCYVASQKTLSHLKSRRSKLSRRKDGTSVSYQYYMSVQVLRTILAL